MIRGRKPPAIIGKPIKGQVDTVPGVPAGRPLIAWYIRDDGPPRLTYRFLFSSSIHPTVKQGKL